jgi:serine/threonine-protein kinase
LFGPDHPAVAIDEINLGLFLCDTRQTAEGLALTTDAVRILSNVLQPGQWEIGAAQSAYGLCLGRAGRFPEGEQVLLEALLITEAALGPDHARVGIVRTRLAEMYEAWGKPEEAAQYRSDSIGKQNPNPQGF